MNYFESFVMFYMIFICVLYYLSLHHKWLSEENLIYMKYIVISHLVVYIIMTLSCKNKNNV